VKKKAYFYSTKITHTVTRLLDSNVFFFQNPVNRHIRMSALF
jgi:hypothetical protein